MVKIDNYCEFFWTICQVSHKKQGLLLHRVVEFSDCLQLWLHIWIYWLISVLYSKLTIENTFSRAHWRSYIKSAKNKNKVDCLIYKTVHSSIYKVHILSFHDINHQKVPELQNWQMFSLCHNLV